MKRYGIQNFCTVTQVYKPSPYYVRIRIFQPTKDLRLSWPEHTVG